MTDQFALSAPPSPTPLQPRALSLTQPWAWLVANGHKDIENRKIGFSHKSFRGEFYIHATVAESPVDHAHATALAHSRGIELPRPGDLQRGGIIGIARIVDIVRAGARHSFWHFPEQFGFIVADARPLPFVACRGALGFWRLPPAVLEQLGGSK